MDLTFIITSLYFYLPPAMANIGANIAKFIPVFKKIIIPVDFGFRYKGKRLVGEHKKIGGFAFGILFGSIVGVFKFLYLDKYMSNYLLLKLNFINTVFLYGLMSLGALLGDITKSIAKRLLNKPAHSPWIPFDQIDHSVISLLFASLFYTIPLRAMIIIVVIYLFLHLLSNLIGYFLGIKDTQY